MIRVATMPAGPSAGGRAARWFAAAAVLVVLCAAGASCRAKPHVEPPEPPAEADLDPEVATLIRRSVDAVREDPDRFDAWANLAMAYDANSFDEQAQTCYVEALRQRQEEPRLWYHLACVRERAGDLDGALAALDRSASLLSTHPSPHRARAEWMLSRGRFDEALEAAEHLDGTDPVSVGPDLVRARVQLERGDHRAAAATLERLVARSPEVRHAHVLLERAYRGKGDLERAKVAGAKGRGAELPWRDPWRLELDRFRPSTRDQYAIALRAAGEGSHDAALALLQPLASRRPGDVEVALLLARTYLKTGRPAEAVPVLHRCLETEPQNVDLLCALSDAERESGDVERALATSSAAVARAPDSAGAHLARGRALAHSGDRKAAVEALERSFACDDKEVEALFLAGLLLLDLEDAGRALDAFERALAVAPVHGGVLGGRVLALHALGRRPEAERALEAAFDLGPEDTRMLHFAQVELEGAQAPQDPR